jgi:hypothetical protein
MKNRKVISVFKVCGLLIIPIVLFLLPADFFDNGTAICLSRTLFDFECYACGITRGVMHFLHFEFSIAWEFNKLTFIVVPVLIGAWCYELYSEYKFWNPPTNINSAKS